MRISSAIPSLLLLAAALYGQDKAPSRADQYQAILKDAALGLEKAKQGIQFNGDEHARRAAVRAFEDAHEPFAKRMFELAKANPGDDPARDAACWVALKAGKGAYFADAMDLLREHHAAGPGTWPIMTGMLWSKAKEYPPLLEEILARNPDRRTRANALYNLAELADIAAEEVLAPTAEMPARWVESGKLWRRLEKEYDDVPFVFTRKYSYGDRARERLEMHRTRIPGCQVDDFDAPDLDGKPMKFSEHAGKVVLLWFWTSASEPSTDMLPFTRDLLTSHRGQPFAVVGVNSDPDKARALEQAKAKGIEYRNYWNGPKGPGGPFKKEWTVNRLPISFLIDGKGVIRHRLLGYPDCPEEKKTFQDKVEALVKEAETLKR